MVRLAVPTRSLQTVDRCVPKSLIRQTSQDGDHSPAVSEPGYTCADLQPNLRFCSALNVVGRGIGRDVRDGQMSLPKLLDGFPTVAMPVSTDFI
jgi:hypothetical protein